MPQEEEQQVSKYNSGINIIMRLDELWKDTHKFSRLGMFDRWNSTLDRAWVELARDIKETDYKDKEEAGKKVLGTKSKYDSFDVELKEVGKFEDKSEDDFRKISPEQIKKRDTQYKILIEKELFLRRLENKLGKGTAWDDMDEDGFD